MIFSFSYIFTYFKQEKRSRPQSTSRWFKTNFTLACPRFAKFSIISQKYFRREPLFHENSHGQKLWWGQTPLFASYLWKAGEIILLIIKIMELVTWDKCFQTQYTFLIIHLSKIVLFTKHFHGQISDWVQLGRKRTYSNYRTETFYHILQNTSRVPSTCHSNDYLGTDDGVCR